MNKGKFTDLLLDAWIFFSGYLSIYILAVLISVLDLERTLEMLTSLGRAPGTLFVLLVLSSACWLLPSLYRDYWSKDH